MSCLHSIYTFVEGFPGGESKRLDDNSSDDLVAAALLLPFSSANVRWPLSTRISCTYATPTMGGGSPPSYPPCSQNPYTG